MALGFVFEWLSLILLLGLGIYVLRIIKNEKKGYIKSARIVHFKQFKLFIPSWWNEIPTDSENELSFKRVDPHYDWETRFTWNPVSENINLGELFKKEIHARKIHFDKETSVIYHPINLKSGALMASGRFEVIRFEGSITDERKIRLYYDAFLVREKAIGAYLYAESKSSVFNGLIEGPYFEEVMTRIELI